MKKYLLILGAAAWISISEFLRNQFLLQKKWAVHYESLGLTFPAKPINGAFWGIWSLVFAGFIYIIRTRFSWLQTTFISWIGGFLMMWIALGNLMVLPLDILPWAIPLSLLEAAIASWILGKNNSDPS